MSKNYSKSEENEFEKLKKQEKNSIHLLTPIQKTYNEEERYVSNDSRDIYMNYYEPWIWEEVEYESIIIKSNDLFFDLEIYDKFFNFNNEGISLDVDVKSHTIQSPTSAFNNLLKIFNQVKPIISLLFGSNNTKDHYKCWIERYDLSENPSTVTSRFTTISRLYSLNSFYSSYINLKEITTDFSKSKDSINMIDLNYIFPPTGPPLV